MPMSGASVPVRSRKSLRQGTGSLCGKSPTGSFAAAGFDCLTEKGNRMIYREAFRDLMPESLLKVDYKEFLSLKHHRRTVKSEQQNNEKDFFLSRLDRDYWKGILDLDAIALRLHPEDPESDGARSYRAASPMGTAPSS